MTDAIAFEQSLTRGEPPAGLSRPLLALWHAGREEWEPAHELAQAGEGDPAHDWVHAHLHRVEGDLGNARYWYQRAGCPEGEGNLCDEWRDIVAMLLTG